MGRPTIFTPELGDKICAEIAEGKSLYTICEPEDMPVPSSVYLWVAKGDRGVEEYKLFSEQYSRAREAQCHALMDQTVPIADDGLNDTYRDEDGNVKTNHDVISRSKLRVETRFKYAEKLHPKKYGNKTLVGSDPENPLPDAKTDPLEIARTIAFILNKAREKKDE